MLLYSDDKYPFIPTDCFEGGIELSDEDFDRLSHEIGVRLNTDGGKHVRLARRHERRARRRELGSQNASAGAIHLLGICTLLGIITLCLRIDYLGIAFMAVSLLAFCYAAWGPSGRRHR